MTSSGADGTYKIGDLAHGKYKLAAVDAGAMAPVQSIELEYEDVLEDVEVRAGDKLVRELKGK
jgi:hypothetical protein